MSHLWITPEANDIYRQTLDRAAARRFIFEWSSQEEAEAYITNVFFTAAQVSEIADGSAAILDLEEDRSLDLAEARLAAAALNRAAEGDRLIAADEARSAYHRLNDTIGSMLAAPLAGRTYPDYLIWQTSARADGWRRVSDAMVAREIRGFFRGPEIESIDPRPGLNVIDAVFAAFVLNFQVGGSDEDIEWNDIMFSNSASAIQGLSTYYR